jgi:hypothetical protein
MQFVSQGRVGARVAPAAVKIRPRCVSRETVKAIDPKKVRRNLHGRIMHAGQNLAPSDDGGSSTHYRQPLTFYRPVKIRP